MSKKTYKVELTEVEKFYILGNYNTDSKELSDLLGKPVNLIDKFKEENPPPPQNDYIHSPKIPNAGDLMARQMKNVDGQNLGAIVLTQASAELSDTTRANNRKKNQTTDYIAKCKK